MKKKSISLLIQKSISQKKNAEKLAQALINKNEKSFSEFIKTLCGNLVLYASRTKNLKKDKAIRALKTYLIEQKAPLVLDGLEDIYEAVAREIKSQAVQKEIGFIFNELDIATLEAIRKNFFWLQSEATERVHKELFNIIKTAFKGDVKREDLSNLLLNKFGSIIKQETRYFRDVTDHIISQGQNLTRIRQGQKYGVKYYRVMAVLDSRTTKICRSMNGRIIPAKHLESQADRMQAAKNIDAKIKAAPWRKDAYLGRSDRLPSNFGIPPYHFRCRTILQPVWVKDEEVNFRWEKVKVKNTRNVPGGLKHIDNTGTERDIDNRVWAHSKHKKPGIKKLIAALNSIRQYAEHVEYPERFVALCANNIVIIFEGDRIYTFMTPDNALKYFKKTANLDKKEIIKCENSLFTFLKGMSGK